jgi:uncharacterized membrane protein
LVFGFGFGFGFGEAVVVDVLGVLAVAGVLAVLDVVGELAVVVVLVACFDPPQPAIASAAINTPES